ncbi:exopolyphosphatase [Colwellia sp. M166]|uniref:exopolyphosphatase n=1 Tax=Colwellia sp. M166 TaxID=2583805 RepID=UPI00211E3252|nr:exopolyphosphatase [Colwellia sp. M166]UUO21929.1 exopolyphosphatase [Colwellia sp. M166]|tara:strand:- start:3150 stop:4082 length:933 start_codon:yes stop_codon:yes gene_type:complete
MSDNKQYRLVTRSDFDGLVCAILLKHINLVNDILFVHPKDMQDGIIAVGANDISTNLPFVDGVHIAFDHHHSETLRNEKKDNHIIDPEAPSAARVVYDYYGGTETFPASWESMMKAVDKGDSAQFDMEEVLHPKRWELLNFIMDSRTGLGRFRDFRISNYELMMDLIEFGKDHSINELLELPDVKERTELYFAHEEKFKAQIKRCATVHGNLVVLDLRDEEIIYSGNRFVIYALFPQCNISIHIMWGLKKQNTVFATGKSIFDRSSTTNVGELMLKYNGGGHNAAGTCQVPHEQNEACLAELISAINADS